MTSFIALQNKKGSSIPSIQNFIKEMKPDPPIPFCLLLELDCLQEKNENQSRQAKVSFLLSFKRIIDSIEIFF